MPITPVVDYKLKQVVMHQHVGAGTPSDKGMFLTDADLKATYPEGASGDFARVLSTGTYWRWSVGDDDWMDSGEAFADGSFMVFADVAAAEASGSSGTVCYVQSVETFYSYESSSSLAVDHLAVLATVNGGDTRWIARAGRYYVLPTTRVEKTGIGEGTTLVDTFVVTAAEGCVWSYVVLEASGKRRAGVIQADWTAAAVEYCERCTDDLPAPGDTDKVSFEVIIWEGDIILNCTVAAGGGAGWVFRAVRHLIY